MFCDNMMSVHPCSNYIINVKSERDLTMSRERLPDKEWQKKIARIEDLLSEDPVGRRIDILRRELSGDLQKAAESVVQAEEAYILTGFFIPNAQTIETDGLSGAGFLAKALTQLGKDVSVLIDPHNKEIFAAGLDTLGIFPTLVSPDFKLHPSDRYPLK